jgi:deoxyribodipyrimidine photo-lyase
MNEKINVFWFRRDLRLNDNHGLFRACSQGLPVLALFIFDSCILKEFPNPNDRRITFIYNRLKILNKELKTGDANLCVIIGKPVEVFEQLFSKFKIQTVFCNHDYEPASQARDQTVRHFLKLNGVGFESYKDQVIFEKNELLTTDGNPYTVFTPFMKKWKQKYRETKKISFPSENFLHLILPHEEPFPRIEQTGYNEIQFDFPSQQPDKQVITNYHLTRDIPSAEGTSRLGIHFRFGTISIRQCVSMAFSLNETWLNELIWREFFMQIMWNFPHVAKGAFKKKYNLIPWRNDEKEFELWCTGNTGFPLVDAGIRELLATGHMHNRVRMITASFLTKLLLTDWQWGERFFAAHLLDYEFSSNNGNWQWAAGTGADAAPYFRIFNPEAQIKRFDKEHQYIRKWIRADASSKPIIDYKSCRERCIQTFKNL